MDVTLRKQEILSQIAAQKALLEAYALVEKDLEEKHQTGLPETPANESAVAVGVTPRKKIKKRTVAASDSESFTAQIRRAFPYMPTPFDMNDVEAWLSGRGAPLPRLRISFVLSRLARTKEIEMVQQGFGTIPGKYVLPQHEHPLLK